MAGTIGTKVCRQRLLEVLTFTDEEGPVVPNAVFRLVAESSCSQGHELQLAAVNEMLEVDERGWLRLNSVGQGLLLGSGHPAPDWRAAGPADRALRDWQAEALERWAGHGRVGVIEAVTGAGKSRVGVEAIREALDHDYSAVVVVPTVELVQQWIRALKGHGLKDVAPYTRGVRHVERIVVGTVQSMYLNPPTRADGKTLLVADECHRYGAGQWRNVLHHSYRRRLGLTATFERNDDGLEALLHYFGGGPLYRIGFDRAIADGVVASYDVKLLPVELTGYERHRYDEVAKTLGEARMQLLAADLPAEPFGTFLFEVKAAAGDEADPTISDVARRYLKAFSERVDILSSATAKVAAVRQLLPLINASKGSLLFTRRIDAAEDLTRELDELGVRARCLHSGLTPSQRRESLSALRTRTVQTVVAPTVLDEGIDVPEVDLGIVMAGSKSRRQMIQRMGRVLRAKPDGRSATFVVVYARDTVEDLGRSDGQEGCLDLIVGSASSVEELGDVDVKLHLAPPVAEPPLAASLDQGPAKHDPPGALEHTPVDIGGNHSEALPGSVAVAVATSAQVDRPASDVGLIDALERLTRLFEQGYLTRDEFGFAKSRLLR
ncbi:DEAD/DEAH box helicase [Ornithinimicrobium cryptoxanthini]|uniref:DEAD/DEAH box helicase n=1 Tax=Ornithinimicrobium cryptoxanthini TaxID=2934161 RepID=UPI002118474A|nr:DEAD/DEAH box helicase [Ornithinimicrobium cryptoxanthini]